MSPTPPPVSSPTDTPAVLLPDDSAAVDLLPTDEQTALLDQLDRAAVGYLAENARPNTTRAYRGDWRAWLTFTSYLGVDPDTARVGLMVAFVEWLRRQQLAPASIDRRLAGVTVTLTEHGVEVPRQVTRAARKALSGYRVKLATTGTCVGRGQAVPLRVDHLKVICAHLDQVCADTHDDRTRLLATRDKALILLGFGLAARRSEIAALHAADVLVHHEGLLITIRADKTSDRPVAVPVLAGRTAATCPRRAWQAWNNLIRQHLPDRQRAFVDLDRRATKMTFLPALDGRDVAAVIKRLDVACKLGLGLTGHSLRAGLATEARRAGHDFTDIATQGRWSKNSTEPYRYMRIVDQWEESATAGLGL